MHQAQLQNRPPKHTEKEKKKKKKVLYGVIHPSDVLLRGGQDVDNRLRVVAVIVLAGVGDGGESRRGRRGQYGGHGVRLGGLQYLLFDVAFHLGTEEKKHQIRPRFSTPFLWSTWRYFVFTGKPQYFFFTTSGHKHYLKNPTFCMQSENDPIDVKTTSMTPPPQSSLLFCVACFFLFYRILFILQQSK